MKKTIIVLLHIGFWLSFALVILTMLSIKLENNADWEPAQYHHFLQVVGSMVVLPAVISFYSFYLFLFPKFLKQKKVVPSILYGALIVLLSVAIAFVFIPQSFIGTCGTENGSQTLFALLVFMCFVTLICGIIAMVILGFITWFEEIQVKETLRNQNKETEMALLKSQLDPHFLFNTINNIDVLILKDAQQASSYLNKLSEIIRFVLYETKSENIALRKEIEYIEKYIELQRIRTSNQSYVNFEVIGSTDDLTIAPVLFIPFIENAFKYTTNKKLKNAITIVIHISNGRMTFTCENRFDPTRKSPQGSKGLGLSLIKKRLHLLYPDSHTLKVDTKNDLFRIHLTIADDKL